MDQQKLASVPAVLPYIAGLAKQTRAFSFDAHNDEQFKQLNPQIQLASYLRIRKYAFEDYFHYISKLFKINEENSKNVSVLGENCDILRYNIQQLCLTY